MSITSVVNTSSVSWSPSESAGDVWGGRGKVRMFCLLWLVDHSNVQAAMLPHGPDELVVPYQPCITPWLPALGFVPVALGQSSPCIA